MRNAFMEKEERERGREGKRGVREGGGRDKEREREREREREAG